MNFILKMAWRDSRASRRKLALFSLSIVAGVAALVTLGSFSASLTRAVHAQARALVGADLLVTDRAPMRAELERFLASFGGERAREVTFTSTMVFPTDGSATRLVQVRALEGRFPFYGDFLTAPAGAVARLRAGGNVVILEETLLSRFHLRVGDPVRLGRGTFTVAGALKRIPGDNLVVALFAPQALIPMDALAGTGLAEHNVLARSRVAVRLPPGNDPEAVRQALRDRFPDRRISVETARSREQDLGRSIANIFDFLDLVGFIALVLGAIGVAGAIHVYIRQKTATVALLRCLGAGARQAFAIYLLQGLALGGFGAVAGAAVGLVAQAAIPVVFRAWLPVAVDFSISGKALVRGLAGGWAVCALFSLLPLLPVRWVSPLAALRATGLADDPAEGRRRLALAQAIVAVATLAAVARLAVSQVQSVTLGLGCTAMLCVALGALGGLARLTAWAARCCVPRGLPYVLRQGLANLHRPNNRTALLLLSLGLGTCLILTLFFARSTLLREIDDAGGPGRPDLLFFDVQDDQIGPLDRLVAARGSPVVDQAPVVAMKISAVDGRPVEDLLAERRSGIAPWTLRREYRSTFRAAASPTERVVAGRFVGRVGPETTVVPISLEDGLARDMRVGLGDEIDWDVQGVPIRTRVASLRSVEWHRLEPNFFVVFPDGVLEAAPKFYVAALRAGDPAQSARLQEAVVGAFPNVTAIDLSLLRQALDGIFSKAAFVVGFMSLLSVATGLVVLAGAVLAGRDQRLRETILLRTIGASRRQLARIQMAEYAALGILAGLLGGALAYAAGALLARYEFHVPVEAPLAALPAAVAAVTALTLLTGRLADRGLAARPPLEALRRAQ